MALLARELGWSITYEDPPYSNTADLLDAPRTLINGKGTIIPRGGRVTLPENVAATAEHENPLALLESVLATEDASQGRVKRFKVLRSGSMFHVVPPRLRDAKGQRRTVVPVLDANLCITR